ncbi:hypothetical protein KKH23_06475 [Patescibacteria group bacterium]|nr:hypothetical protein [Patescibacteria group bacterium]
MFELNLNYWVARSDDGSLSLYTDLPVMVSGLWRADQCTSSLPLDYLKFKEVECADSPVQVKIIIFNEIDYSKYYDNPVIIVKRLCGRIILKSFRKSIYANELDNILEFPVGMKNEPPAVIVLINEKNEL